MNCIVLVKIGGYILLFMTKDQLVNHCFMGATKKNMSVTYQPHLRISDDHLEYFLTLYKVGARFKKKVSF